jgi:1-acyl-sn-glycerol-3-phosphate acyltransferase
MTQIAKQHQSIAYQHSSFWLRRRFLRFLLSTIAFPWLVRIKSVEGLENIPESGPAILLINHIAFVDPIVVLQVLQRDIVPLAKIEVYELPFVGLFPKMWGVIPIRRDEVDRRAVQKSLAVLKAGEMILVAPEGTRNEALQSGKEGVAYLASRSGAPIIPVALEGTEGYPSFPILRSWWNGGARLRFGRPFRYLETFKRARGERRMKRTE